ncbi:hypothetical protein KKG90_11620, partial [Candidatus Bipolaricaulota bacterium]|nr:hypothetical protein [Candidatus Bipolaricaulota bacterium]
EQKLRHEVVEHLDGSTPRRMDENCYWFTDRIIGLCWEAARQKDEPIPETSINNQLEFIRSELSL